MEQNREDVLIEEITGDAEKKAGRTKRRAEREARQIVEKAEKEAEEVRKTNAESAEQKAEKEKKIILATVDLEANRIELDISEQLITEAFDKAVKQVYDKESYDYQAVLARLIASAVGAIWGDEFEIRLAKEDHDTVDVDELNKKVNELLDREVSLKINDQPARIKGGVMVYSSDGRKMVDNSFQGRLARMREDLRRQTADIIFGEKES